MLEVGESRSLEAIGHSIGHIHMSLHITDCSNNVFILPALSKLKKVVQFR